ncbi:MAG: hypothetical protein ABW278_01490 [Steroidobacteraceae bacterium]
MKPQRWLVVAVAAAGLCAGGAAQAVDGDLLQLDGFGTLGLVHSSESQADYPRSQLVPDGAGASHRWSPKVDSVLGGQLSVHWNPRLSAVVQLISEQRASNSYQPRVEWANLSYQVTPDLTLGVGRIASPIFMLTDTRRLSYALPWMRPPVEVYDLFPATSNDGLNLRWRARMGSTTQLLEIAAGRSDTPFSRNGFAGTAESREQFIVRDTLERGPWSVVLGYSSSRLTIPELAPLFDGFRRFGNSGEAIAVRYSAVRRSVRYYGAAASYDPGRWFATAEWARLKVAGALKSNTGWYASTGLRAGAYTPYVAFAQTRPAARRSDPGLDLTLLPPGSVPAAAALNNQLNTILADVPGQATFSAGLRWDFAARLCLKLQYDHVDLASGNAGTLANQQPGFQPGGVVHLVGASVSFVL